MDDSKERDTTTNKENDQEAKLEALARRLLSTPPKKNQLDTKTAVNKRLKNGS